MSSLDYASRICYSSRQTLEFTYEMAVKYKDSPGDYCECGVAAGAQVIAMLQGAPKKTVYAFDSFQGICLPSNRDDQMPGIKLLSKQEQEALPNPGEQVLETTGASSVSEEDFLVNVMNAFMPQPKNLFTSVSLGYLDVIKNVIPIKGWFEETMPRTTYVKELSILRLDGDLYNSTWVCLQHLFPKVIKGGCVIIDDWELLGCRAACDEYFDLIGYKPDYKFISNISYFYK